MTGRRRPRPAGASGGAADGARVSSGAVRTSAAGGSESVVSLASGSGKSCSVTPGGSGARAHGLGATFGLPAVDGDRGAPRVDWRDGTCGLGGRGSGGRVG